jgi:hypothetical protein
MIQVKIKNIASQNYTHGPVTFKTIEETQSWIDSQLSVGLNCAWGKPEHTIQVEISPYIPAVYEEEGELISEAVEAIFEDQVVPSEFTIEIEDITEQVEQERINTTALRYLAETDWIVTRAMERGEELSSEFKAEREAARASVVR